MSCGSCEGSSSSRYKQGGYKSMHGLLPSFIHTDTTLFSHIFVHTKKKSNAYTEKGHGLFGALPGAGADIPWPVVSIRVTNSNV